MIQSDLVRAAVGRSCAVVLGVALLAAPAQVVRGQAIGTASMRGPRRTY